MPENTQHVLCVMERSRGGWNTLQILDERAPLPPLTSPLMSRKPKSSKVIGKVIFLGRDEKQEKVEAFLQEHGYTFPVYYDHAMTTIQQLGIQAFPTTLFIDAEGYVVDSHVGMLNAQELDSYLALLH